MHLKDDSIAWDIYVCAVYCNLELVKEFPRIIENDDFEKIYVTTDCLLTNIHETLPTFDTGETTIIRGIYEYWHYGCDGFNDRGWGCGYRTLQTICSWIIINKNLQQKVPSIRNIQETLVTLEDKEKSFIGSRDWIGCFEVCLILDNFYNVNSKIVHIRSGQELSKYLHVIKQHFEEFGCPIMMGGDQDCSSKCIIGMHTGLKEAYLLIIDPHFIGKAKSIEELKSNQWVKWQSIKDFVYSSFYNLCLPQIKIT
uniref:UFSP1/2/DUB catalytic domain-containing protein n=1 Tax=Vespula pensylvanica TaxID=30213 RepID=A0A834UCM9_VESPE|nr:hypothetical protein H0235_006507 [Vespula pensylvanica]